MSHAHVRVEVRIMCPERFLFDLRANRVLCLSALTCRRAHVPPIRQLLRRRGPVAESVLLSVLEILRGVPHIIWALPDSPSRRPRGLVTPRRFVVVLLCSQSPTLTPKASVRCVGADS
jgi:hypothetical protein